MAVETNARIEFSVSSVEEWEKVNPKLHQGEPVFAKKPSGKYILKVGAPGGSTYKNAVVVWDQDDAETKMTSTQEAAAQALASKNAASASASAAKASENAAAASKSAAAKSEANAKTSETNAAASKTSAANSANTASAKATVSANSASAAATSESNALKSASAAATSESNALKSSNAANTSANKAKVSETNAAKSATAAAQSAENAKTWDPTRYTKTIQLTKEDNNGNNVLILLEQITDYDKYNYHRCGGSFSIYPYVRTGANHQLKFPPVHCSLSLPYNTSTNDGYIGWTTNATYVPLVVKNNTTNKVYWGISVKGSGHTALIFGAFEHNIYVIDKLLSSSATDTYDGWTVLQTAEIKTLAETSKVDDVLTKLKGYLALSRIGKKVVEDEGITDLNAVEFLSYPSWYCRLSKTVAKLQNCPTPAAFHLFNFSNSDNNGDLPNLKDKYYSIIQVLIDINGNIWRRCAFNGASTKFNFTAWAKSAVTSDLPTKTSQLTNDSDVANAAALEAEAKKWKDAYNKLRKRSVPAAFDDDELTELIDAPIGTGDVTLSQPYTDFDGLLIDYAGDNGNYVISAYISTAELNRRVAVAKSAKATVIHLLEKHYYWTIYITEASGFSSTYFPCQGENCQIKHIYGVKLNEIT